MRSFVAVLDAGSLSGAARASGLQQPTLSRHIAQLEAQWATPLFERTGRGVAPTAAALALADAARAMAEQAQRVSHTLKQQKQSSTGTVRLSTSEVAASYLLPPLLAELAQAEPGIHIELVANNGIDNLLRREADIAVRMLRPQQSSLLARKVGEVAIVAAAHERYLERSPPLLQPSDLLGHRLIGYDRDETILRGFAALGIALTKDRFVLRTDNQLAYGRLVASGAGVGFVAAYNLAHWKGVRPLLPMLKIPPLPCWLAVHREIRSRGVVRRVFDFLGERLPSALMAPSAFS